MESVFEKPKIVFHPKNEKGIVKVVIQDESYTLMEPLITILQADHRLMFAGYKTKHCLGNEMIVKLKSRSDSEKEIFKDALQTLLTQLECIPDIACNQ